MCKRNGGDSRGSAAARRIRKSLLLSDPRYGGDGITVNCVHCATILTYATLQQDRIIPGGSYVMANLLPSCGPCNKLRSDKKLSTFNPALVSLERKARRTLNRRTRQKGITTNGMRQAFS
jgi:hypothetical protein